MTAALNETFINHFVTKGLDARVINNWTIYLYLATIYPITILPRQYLISLRSTLQPRRLTGSLRLLA